ncbi:NAD-dependent epimerase/dehydratase family protein [Flavobacterium enshiense]|uniref:NAD-dependent epimerase/dehydratase family protein n=1 Tax=Flavobacterium enshiense TaxID=1341165 RepID=UPI00345CBC4E
MKVFVTGATGYLGNTLAHALADEGNEVHALVRSEAAKSILQHPNIRLFRGDLSDKEVLIMAMKGCEQVYHTAAKVGVCIDNYKEFYQVNVEGTRNVLYTALRTGVEKAVFTSTCGVIGPSEKEPLNEASVRMIAIDNAYDATKKASEDLIFEHAAKGFDAIVVSPCKIYGPGTISHALTANSVITMFLKKGFTIVPGSGDYKVCFAFVADIVNGHLLAMRKGRSGEKYILGGCNVSYQQFFSTLREIAATQSQIISLSKNTFKALAFLQWAVYKTFGNRPFFTSQSVDYLFHNYVFSSDKAIRELGYQITPLREGLEQTVSYLHSAHLQEVVK